MGTYTLNRHCHRRIDHSIATTNSGCAVAAAIQNRRQFTIQYLKHVTEPILLRVKVKLPPAARDACMGATGDELHDGLDGSPELSVIC